MTSWTGAAGALALAFAFAGSACGDSSSSSSDTVVDTGNGNDGVTGDVVGTPDADTTGGDDTALVDTGNGDPDAADTGVDAGDTTVGVDVTDQPNGAACSGDGQCLDGTCLGAPDGVCARGCGLSDECEAGQTCETLPSGDKVCVGADDLAGLPCVSNDGCVGDTVCQALDDGTSRCVFPCNDFNCDTGFTCDTDTLACLPPEGFDCTPFDVASGLVGRCTVDNEFGTCGGEFGCAADGSAACSARTPAAEVCDGEDNDCDIDVDEGVCSLFIKSHAVSAAINYTPDDAHWIQCSVGHSGPTGADTTATGHRVHWGFHATRP